MIDGERVLFVCVDCHEQFDFLAEGQEASDLRRCAECHANLVERARLESTQVAGEESGQWS